jgi:3-dehydroquinate synthetase
LREILNFGHTIGHALEARAEYRLAHGTAVAAGMVLEARIGEALGVTAPGTGDRLAQIVVRLGLSFPPLSPQDAKAALAFVRSDKKARQGRARYVLLERLGRVARAERWSREVPDEVVEGVLDRWSRGA